MQKNKKRPRIFENLGMKIGSLVIAFVMWLIITNVSDPVISTYFSNVPVKLNNASAITDQGKVYTVLNGTDVIPTVTVTGARSVIDQLSLDNIVAQADLRTMSEDGTVNIFVSTNRYKSQIDSIKPSISQVLLSVEDRKTSKFALKAVTVGEPAAGYVLGDVTVDQNQVRVSGPASVVSSVAEARAEVDVSGSTGTVTTNVDVKLLDKDGAEIDTSNLSMNITSVRVNAAVLPTKEVPVTASASGTPGNGYMTTGVVTTDPETILVAAKASVLDDLDGIAIPDSAVDVTGAAEDVTKEINVADYLPENVRLADVSSGVVTVTVGIEQVMQREITVSPDAIEFVNVPEGYTVSLVSARDGLGNVSTADRKVPLKVVLRGLGDTLNDVRGASLSPVIDVQKTIDSSRPDAAEDELAGSYSADAALTIPERTTLQNAITVLFTLVKDE